MYVVDLQNLKLNLSSNFDNNLLSDSDYEEDSTPAGLRAHRNSCQRAVVQRRRVGQRTTSENNISQQYRRSRRAQGELTTQNGDIFAIYEDAETEDEAGFFGFFYAMEL